MISPEAPPRKPRLAHWIEYLLLCAGAAALRLLPHSIHLPLSRAIARVWYYLVPFRKGVVLQNLALAFPEKTPGWQRETAIACAQHFVRTAFEFAALRNATREDVQRLVAKVEGREHLDAITRESKSLIAVSGHFGAWELLTSYLAAVENLDMAVLAKPLHNPLVENMVSKTRRKRGFEIIYTGKDVRPVLEAARRNRILAFVADQDARREGVFVPFLGAPASTFRGPAVFARRLNLPILVFTCRRATQDGRYHVRISPPIHPQPDADRRGEIERLTRLHTAQLESAVRECPEQYFWFHRRWKTRPKQD